MIRRAEKKDEKKLKEFLQKDPVYNTFLLADLETYGFDKEFQHIYVEENQGSYRVVYLTFYNNLILAGDSQSLDSEFLKRLKEEGITVILGRGELVKKAGEILEIPALPSQERYLYSKEKKTKPVEDSFEITEATEKDVDKIYDFLMSVDELRNMYQSKEMLERRIKYKEGTHIYIEQEGELVAHANTTARAEKTVMIGGIGVRDDMRGKGLASKVVSYLADQALDGGRIPCLFSTYTMETSFMRHIGFQEIGIWGTVEIK